MGPLQELQRAARRWPSVVKDCKAPEEAQARVWEGIRRMLGNAAYWRGRFGDRIPALEDLEITTYEDYRDAIERSWLQTTSELNGEPLEYWCLSSGSTGPKKKFPWTRTFHEQHLEGSDLPLPMFEAIARLRGRGPLLSLVYAHPLGRSPAGVPTGPVTNYLAPKSNRIYPRSLDYDPEMANRWIPLYALAAELAGIRAVSCDHIFMLIDRIERDRSFYLAGIRGEVEIPEGLPAPAPSADRAAYLSEVLGSPDPLRLHTLWPTMRIVHAWKSATAGLQAAQLARQTAEHVRFVDLTYGATEGPIAQPIDPDAVGGPIHPGSIIHEFVEAGAAMTRDNVLKAWEIEPGRNYEVLMTTAMGMVRYRIGDVVHCTGRFHRVPTLRYEGRLSGELSLGVTTHTDAELVHVLKAVRQAPRARRVFGPSDDARGLVLYTDTPLEDDQMERLHVALAEANATYKEFTNQQRVARVSQRFVPSDDPLWTFCKPRHSQAKPVILLLKPPSELVG